MGGRCYLPHMVDVWLGVWEVLFTTCGQCMVRWVGGVIVPHVIDVWLSG